MSLPTQPSCDILSELSRRVLKTVLDDLDDGEVAALVKNKLMGPLVRSMYDHVYPYILLVTVLMAVNLSFSVLSCFMCLLGYFRR